VLVDVGAHGGAALAPFARDGWHVIAIEPDPENRAQLENAFGSSPNVDIVPKAIWERDGATVPLYTSRVSSGISALAPFHPSHRMTTTVATVRLDTLLSDTAEVTVLKTDTEGWDLPVLKTFPWDRLHPLVVISEFEDRKTVPLGYRYDDLGAFLVERGYVVLTSEWWPVIEYGRRHTWRRIERYPTPLMDAGAWGNFIAAAPTIAENILRAAGGR
jgi:FkbM family methyltransferase